ncbi:uncharacterized [Tachysurus ichikawai]
MLYNSKLNTQKDSTLKKRFQEKGSWSRWRWKKIYIDIQDELRMELGNLKLEGIKLQLYLTLVTPSINVSSDYSSPVNTFCPVRTENSTSLQYQGQIISSTLSCRLCQHDSSSSD